MAKYFAHKPQYRRGTTPRPAPVLEFDRDFRSGEFQFTGPAFTPDPRSAPGRVPSVPRQAGRTWGSPVNFNTARGTEAAAKRAFYRNLGRGIGGVMRGAQLLGDLWDMYDDVSRMLGGEPFSFGSEVPFGGGPVAGGSPSGNYDTRTHPNAPGKTLVIPTPDGASGWETIFNPYWIEGAMTGMYQDTPYPYHARPFPSRWGFFHSPMPNPYGSYTPNQVNQMPDPPLLSDGKWWFQSRLQIGGWVIYPPEWWRVSAPSGMWGKPGPSGQPLPYPVDYPGPFVVSNPSEIPSAWPKTGSVTHTVLPWPEWRPGPAWRDIPARNRLRAQFPDIRQESYGPPVDPNKPSQIIHRPPGRNETESKRRTNSAAVLWWYRAAKKSWHEAGEYCDRVSAIYDALPKDVRLPYRKGDAIACHEKTAVILRNLDRLDVNQAILNLVENEIEDAIIGAGFKNLDNAAKRLGIPGWRVDLAMSGNVEEAIAFLFEIKKALTP